MGLLDALGLSPIGAAAALGSGLSSYVNESNELELRKQEQDRRRRAEEFDRASKNASLLQGLMQSSVRESASNPSRLADAAGIYPELKKAYGSMLGPGYDVNSLMPNLKPQMVYQQTPQALPQYGPMWSGKPLPPRSVMMDNKQLPKVPNYNTPEMRNTLEAWSGYVAPKPEAVRLTPGDTVGHYDPSGKFVIDGMTPDPLGELKLKSTLAGRDIEERKLAESIRHNKRDEELGAGRLEKMGTGASGEKWRLQQNINLLENARDLAKIFGGTITSYGMRPLGTPNDTADTLVNGKQTEWGLYNAYRQGVGAPAAYPGTSAHGNGAAVDIVIPPSAQKRFLKEAASRGIKSLFEKDGSGNAHFHITAPDGSTPIRSKPQFNTNAAIREWKSRNGVPPGAPLNQQQQDAMASWLDIAKQQYEMSNQINQAQDAIDDVIDEWRREAAQRGGQ